MSAKCKSCGHGQSNKAARMKKHQESCMKKTTTGTKRNAVFLYESHSESEQQSPPTKKARIQTDLEQKVFITTESDKQRMDTLLAKFFFACNIPFSVTEHPSFIEFASASRPGYKPPTRKVLSSTVLDSVTDELQTDMKSKLDGKECTFILEDGCSNCHNDPVTASCVHADKQAYFMDANNWSN